MYHNSFIEIKPLFADESKAWLLDHNMDCYKQALGKIEEE
jgi:hypothetical protein